MVDVFQEAACVPTLLFRAGKWYSQSLQRVWQVGGGRDPSKAVILNQGGFPPLHSTKRHLAMSGDSYDWGYGGANHGWGYEGCWISYTAQDSTPPPK